MGILTDLFIASKVELASKDLSLIPFQENGFPAVQAKNVDPLALLLWEECLTGVHPPESSYEEALGGVYDGGSDGPWVGRVRDEFVAAFARASDEKLIDAAIAWAKELGAEDEVVEITHIFKEVRALAFESKTSRRPMYLWTCL